MLDKIKEKSEIAGLQTKLTTRQITLFDDTTEDRTELYIQIPFERETKTILINQKYDGLEKIYNSDFEKFKFLKGFEAIYSPELGIIECEIQSGGDVIRGVSYLFRRLARIFKQNIDINYDTQTEEKKIIFEFPSPNEKIKIYLGQSSISFSFLNGNKADTIILRNRIRPFPTIRIEGLEIQNHNHAKEILSTIGNSVFFQIDLITNIPVHLTMDKGLQREINSRKAKTRNDIEFTPPKFQYDKETISLYWYARTATNMPLLQFLAFYQVIEFYFPQYSSKDAQERIKNLLKDPTFDRNSDKNIAKILEIVKITAKGKAIGDERSQIKATIMSTVDVLELNEFFNEIPDRQEFFDDQKKGKTLVSQKIAFSRKDHDIRIDVASRIYDLRCRIVHTKEDAETELLLPFSQELALIKFDIDLIEFIARKVLIASGKQIELG